MINIEIPAFSEDQIKYATRKHKKSRSGHDPVPCFVLGDCSGVLVKPLLTEYF